MVLMDKFWTWLGVQGDEVREELLELPDSSQENRGTANVVSIHSNKTMKVVVCEPETYDEVQMLADHLKAKKQVILNFENTSNDVSQRIIDFLSGTTYSLDGNSQRLGPNIFIFTPSNVEIATDHRALMRKQGLGRVFGGEK